MKSDWLKTACFSKSGDKYFMKVVSSSVQKDIINFILKIRIIRGFTIIYKIGENNL